MCCHCATINGSLMVKHVFVFNGNTFQPTNAFWQWQTNCIVLPSVLTPITRDTTTPECCQMLRLHATSAANAYQYMCNITPPFYTSLSVILHDAVSDWCEEISMLAADEGLTDGLGLSHILRSHFATYTIQLASNIEYLLTRPSTQLLSDKPLHYLRTCFKQRDILI